MNKNQLLENLFQAYYDARANKRNTINALSFEINYESHLFQLYEEIISRNYTLKPSICFINYHPVQREIFAANFRDRVIHHLIYNYISPYFEKTFINDSYSCRKYKGTHYGIKRINKFIRSCSHNYTKDCYVLKLDIKGYFMAMERNILFEMIKKRLLNFEKTVTFDFKLVLYLIEKVIFNDPIKGCTIKGKRSNWNGLPNSKSLFYAGKDKGLPIGNLTSQLFGNIYLNDFDHFVKTKLGIKYYGRYVDDFVVVHSDNDYLKLILPVIKQYLQDNLQLELHPNKIYLQHYTKGVKFLGTVIKPYRIYIANRTKANFYHKIQYWNNYLKARNNKMDKEELKLFISCINSYLGIMKHYKTYRLRKKMLLKNLSAYYWNYVCISGDYCKIEPKVKSVKRCKAFVGQ